MTDEQRKLVEDNHNLIYSFLQSCCLSIEECYDLAAIGLCKAAMHYKNDIGLFSTLAYKCMRNEIGTEFRKKTADKYLPENLVTSYDAELHNDNGDVCNLLAYIPDDTNVETEALSNLFLENYIKRLKDRDKLIIKLFSLGYTQKEIGKIVGCSQPEVSRVKSRMKRYFEEVK